MKRQSVVLLALVAVVLLVHPSPTYGASARGVVTANGPQDYMFTMPADGAVEITLTWNQNHEDVYLVMACSAGGQALEYSSVATQARVARLDVGLLGGLDCLFRISSFQRKGTFIVALSTSDSGPGLRRSAGWGGALELVQVGELEAAAFGLPELEAKVRSMRR